MDNKSKVPAVVISQQQLVDHWQGHRRLTRRMIEAFPEDKLFTYSVGGMRPFAELAIEMIGMATPGVQGVASGKWDSEAWKIKADKPTTKKDLLALWDQTTKEIDDYWPTIPPHRFQEIDTAYGQWEAHCYWILFYAVDNEIHHRGQGYVYLRTLGIEPPPFWER
jgi:uncharacterized damage-inducible protein DinB